MGSRGFGAWRVGSADFVNEWPGTSLPNAAAATAAFIRIAVRDTVHLATAGIHLAVCLVVLMMLRCCFGCGATCSQ